MYTVISIHKIRKRMLNILDKTVKGEHFNHQTPLLTMFWLALTGLVFEMFYKINALSTRE